MPMTRDDLNELAALLNMRSNATFDLTSISDDQLLTLVWHEILHAYFTGRYVLAELPPETFRRVVTDARMMRLIVEETRILTGPPEPMPLTLADRLDRGVAADIWYDHGTFGDDECEDGTPMSELIEDTQNAMREAAALLRAHGLDR